MDRGRTPLIESLHMVRAMRGLEQIEFLQLSGHARTHICSIIVTRRGACMQLICTAYRDSHINFLPIPKSVPTIRIG